MADETVESTIEIYTIATGERRTVYRAREHFEAPNWSREGARLIVNSRGRLYTIPVGGGAPAPLDCGHAVKCNNDHGLSPDGRLLAISDQTDGPSAIYVLPAAGGAPRRVTPLAPSYWHGWSPDGERLAYCGARGGQYDIYTISVEGGEETRLTNTGFNDGPDYSPDGRHIYFNSERGGAMRIWRTNVDGSDQRMITSDAAYGDWFPHPSPDGEWLVFLSYEGSVKGHPANKNVALRMMPLPDAAPAAAPRVLFELFGGQGTINVPSWSPDSTEFAFVSYRLL